MRRPAFNNAITLASRTSCGSRTIRTRRPPILNPGSSLTARWPACRKTRKSSYSTAMPCEYTACNIGMCETVEVQFPLSSGEGTRDKDCKHGTPTVELKYGLISVDDHAEDQPE